MYMYLILIHTFSWHKTKLDVLQLVLLCSARDRAKGFINAILHMYTAVTISMQWATTSQAKWKPENLNSQEVLFS